jgi:hypothetical protein
VVIPFSEIRLIEKKMTALVIPNAIGVSTVKEKVGQEDNLADGSTHSPHSSRATPPTTFS